MKDFNLQTKAYIFGTIFSALIISLLLILTKPPQELLTMMVLSILALLFSIFKVTGATERSHFSINFLVFGFTLAHLGITEVVLVILFSSVLEWLLKRPAWYIHLFNTSCYIIVIFVASLVFFGVSPGGDLNSLPGIIAIFAAMATFTLLNHLMVGIVIWFARDQNFKESGIFDYMPLIIDVTMLSLGALLEIIWDANYFAVLLFALPLYLIYSTLKMPALERQTEIDQKTGLFNHAYFMRHLTNELERANRFDTPLTLIMADLDLLRNINNTYGHLAGDEVLIGIAQILKQSVREYDVVARFGGEEFSILFAQATTVQAFERAEAIRNLVANTSFSVPTSISPIRVTLSLGVASRERFDQPAQEIIHNADTALYKSKLLGRNQTFAFEKGEFFNLSGRHERVDQVVLNDMDKQPPGGVASEDNKSYKASSTKYNAPVQERNVIEVTGPPAPREKERQTKRSFSIKNVNSYISAITAVALILFSVTYYLTRSIYEFDLSKIGVGILISCVLIILSEWFSIDLYLGKTSLSTSAVPLLAGSLLFGPIGALALSLVYSITVGIKYHNQINRYFFNASNQLISSMIYLLLVYLIGTPFTELPVFMQLALSLIAAVIIYVLNTWLIALGISIDLKQSAYTIWKEQYLWLFSVYMAMGVIAAGLIFGYRTDKIFGPLLILVPLALLRISQKQYIDRTREMVSELREKNIDLEHQSKEIAQLNEGLLDTLAEIIDMRDPYVLGHSRQVTQYATRIAKNFGLGDQRIELIRKASLLHDIGKLGIPYEILVKPARLTPDEYETVKTHAHMGGQLLEKSPALRAIVPIVRHHHEYFNGKGYPDGLAENQIPIEARIISVSDAIEAMSSDRPYRKALTIEIVIAELQKNSGTQFDPQVVDKAIEMLRLMYLTNPVREPTKIDGTKTKLKTQANSGKAG